jgi:DNA-binding LytR/AlgR family response regulator
MQSAEQLLKNYPFAKCSHWYLVNLFHISEINKNTVTVAGKKLEISRRSKAAFLEAATNYLGGNT